MVAFFSLHLTFDFYVVPGGISMVMLALLNSFITEVTFALKLQTSIVIIN